VKRFKPNIAGEFKTFDDWVNRASRTIAERYCPVDGVGDPQRPMCIDSKGRRVQVGRDFMRARDEGTFPVYYFWNCENAKG
jgi:hypothetical protein